MKFETQNITAQVAKIKPLLRKYAVFTFIIVFLCIYVFMVQQIGNLINAEAPAQPATESTTKPITGLKVDEAAAKQMEQLESQNIEIQTLFSEARRNPFSE